MTDAGSFAAFWRFRKAIEEEVHPLLEKLALGHGLLFSITWRRTRPELPPRMELAISWPRQKREAANKGTDGWPNAR